MSSAGSSISIMLFATLFSDTVLSAVEWDDDCD
jgi:hypothetical protein